MCENGSITGISYDQISVLDRRDGGDNNDDGFLAPVFRALAPYTSFASPLLRKQE